MWLGWLGLVYGGGLVMEGGEFGRRGNGMVHLRMHAGRSDGKRRGHRLDRSSRPSEWLIGAGFDEEPGLLLPREGERQQVCERK